MSTQPYMKGEVIGLISGPLEVQPEDVTGYLVIVTTDTPYPRIKVIGQEMSPDYIISLLLRTLMMVRLKEMGVDDD